MTITFDFINGLCFGLQFVSKDTEDLDDPRAITESVILIHFAFIECIIWLGDSDEPDE